SESMVPQPAKEGATRTPGLAGDGTTPATVLARALIREGLKNVAAGANPQLLKRGIERAVAAVVEEIQRIAQPVETPEAIGQVASISADDKEIGDRKSTRLNSSHVKISYAVFCLKKNKSNTG